MKHAKIAEANLEVEWLNPLEAYLFSVQVAFEPSHRLVSYRLLRPQCLPWCRPSSRVSAICQPLGRRHDSFNSPRGFTSEKHELFTHIHITYISHIHRVRLQHYFVIVTSCLLKYSRAFLGASYKNPELAAWFLLKRDATITVVYNPTYLVIMAQYHHQKAWLEEFSPT